MYLCFSYCVFIRYIVVVCVVGVEDEYYLIVRLFFVRRSEFSKLVGSLVSFFDVSFLKSGFSFLVGVFLLKDFESECFKVFRFVD